VRGGFVLPDLSHNRIVCGAMWELFSLLAKVFDIVEKALF
jgi:hypothetical protein